MTWVDTSEKKTAHKLEFDYPAGTSLMETLNRETLIAALSALNERLRLLETSGEICVYGGGVMVLAFNARLSTQDLDAAFLPAEVIRRAAVELSTELGLRPDWINDGVKGWLSAKGEYTADSLPQFSHLRLTRPTEQYLLAMKCLAARTAGFGTQGDKNDIIFLVQRLGLRTSEEVLSIVEKFYPQNQIQPKTRFLVEEIMSEIPSEGTSSF